MKKVIQYSVVAVLFLVLSGVSACALLSENRPEGSEGAEAEALAAQMLESVNASAWEQTGAVRWNFPRGHEHLWDKRRNLAKVKWKSYEVYVNLSKKTGVALKDGERVTEGKESQELVEKAWAMWANDSFWLNPVVKIRDGGTTRELITLEDGSKALLVTYGKGGVTPGDAYLWLVDQKTGKPQGWKMWVSVLPVGGMEFEWKSWIELSTGALVAKDHDGLFDVNLTNIEGAKTLKELVGEPDPFSILE